MHKFEGASGKTAPTLPSIFHSCSWDCFPTNDEEADYEGPITKLMSQLFLRMRNHLRSGLSVQASLTQRLGMCPRRRATPQSASRPAMCPRLRDTPRPDPQHSKYHSESTDTRSETVPSRRRMPERTMVFRNARATSPTALQSFELRRRRALVFRVLTIQVTN